MFGDQPGQVPCREELRDLAVCGCEAPFGRADEESGVEHEPGTRRVADELGGRRVLRGRTGRAGEGIAGRAGDQLAGEETTGDVEQRGGVGLAGVGDPVLLVGFGDERRAGEFEGIRPGDGPLAGGNCGGEHVEVLGIVEQPVQAALSCVGHEGTRVQVVVVLENARDVGLRQGLEAYDHDVAVGGGVPEMVAVVATQPVGPAAGEPKSGAIEAMELGDDLVEDRTGVGEPGAALVEAVEEQCRAAPLGLVEGSEELAHGNPDAAGRRGLLIERGGLAGARFADEDVGGDVGEGPQGGGVESRRTVGVADGRDGPGREVDHGRGVGGAWQVVLASTPAAIGAPRCTSRNWGPSNPPTRVRAISMSPNAGRETVAAMVSGVCIRAPCSTPYSTFSSL